MEEEPTEERISFVAIDHSNFSDAIALKRPEDEDYVAPVLYSLAEAWLYRAEGSVNPFLACLDGKAIAFVMTHTQRSSRTLDIWRLLIPPESTNRGFGTRILKKLIAESRRSGAYDALELSYVPGNALAEHVYDKMGFKPTGDLDDGEIIMRLTL